MIRSGDLIQLPDGYYAIAIDPAWRLAFVGNGLVEKVEPEQWESVTILRLPDRAAAANFCELVEAWRNEQAGPDLARNERGHDVPLLHP